jgi:hypothetical protein
MQHQAFAKHYRRMLEQAYGALALPCDLVDVIELVFGLVISLDLHTRLLCSTSSSVLSMRYLM